MIEELVGHYRVVATLGSGGMGVVWKAIDTRLNRPVAIKAIRESDPANTDAVLRLRAEALAAASLDHPYICKIYELLETGSATLVVMEFVEGETLGDILGRAKPPLVDTLRYGSEIAEGLANAHARGIVHRDVKPTNVMVTPHGHIKLLDFGIARINDAAALTQSGLTLPGNVPGTPQYMAPEQALGQPIDGRADLFSLGVVLFRCLTGRLPFDGETRDAYVQNMLLGRMHSLDALAPEVPEPVREIVAACLEKDPADRPATAGAVGETLRRVAEALSTGQHPVSRSRRGMPRWAMQLAGFALVAGAIALGAYRLSPLRVPAEPAGTLLPAVTWPSAELDARISPDGRWLSFISDRENQSRIFVQAIEGGEPVPVNVQGTVLGHTWSPDGRELAAVVSQGDAQFAVVVPAFFGGSPRVSIPFEQPHDQISVLRWLDAGVYLDVNRGQAGHALLRVDLPSGRIHDVSAAWKDAPVFRSIDVSPDGRRVVMDGALKDGGYRLWTASLDGSALAPLSDGTSVDREPLWTGPDTVVVRSGRGGQQDLWQVSVTTQERTQLTTSPMTEDPTGVSPDGRTIVFEQTSNTANIWRLDLATGAERQLTGDALGDFWPSISPDGTRAAFQRAARTSNEGFLFLDSRVRVGDTTELGTRTQEVAEGFGPRLSADGSWVAYYQRTGVPTLLRLRAKNLMTGADRVLSERCVLPAVRATSAPVDWVEQNVTWSGSGAVIFFIAAGEAGHEIRRADLSGPADPSVLVAGRGGRQLRDLRLSPDGAALAYLARAPRQPGAASNETIEEVRVLRLASGDDRVVSSQTLAPRIRSLPGWSGSAALVLLRAALRPSGSYRLEITELSLEGRRRQVAAVDDGVIPAVHVEPAGRRVFVTRNAGGVHNLHVIPIRDGSSRRLTTNQSPGVSFSGIQPAGNEAIVYVRDERKRDIWLMQRTVR